MSLFVDTGVFYAHADVDAPRNDEAERALDAVTAGGWGTPVTSDFVLDEAVTLTRTRTGDVARALAVGRHILGEDPYPRTVELLDVDSETVREALSVLERYDDQSLSFTDATTVALVEDHGIDRVLSFDDDFDGVVDRLDPGDVDDEDH